MFRSISCLKPSIKAIIQNNSVNRPHSLYRFFSQTYTSSKGDLFVTEECKKNFEKIVSRSGKSKDSAKLRIYIGKGGCSGLQYLYQMDYGSETELDEIRQIEGVKIAIDCVSWERIKGSTIDWEDEMIRTGFVVTKNPNADSSCSGGSAFKPKEEKEEENKI
ncbi:hypothetical protein WA158_006047 [Blastocystis sp. Blastoise]